MKKCPTCSNEITIHERYPNYICSDCCNRTLTKDGDKIEFYNVDGQGGIYSVVDDIVGDIHECYIDDIECRAECGRFGGIVIQIREN